MKYDDLIDAQVRLLQSHTQLVEELHKIADTKNRLAMIFRAALEEPLAVAKYPPVHPSTCRISVEAAAILGEQPRPTERKGAEMGLRYEHPVPLTSVLYPLIVEALPDASKARQIIIDYLRPTWITIEEDQRLSELGLRSSMPKNWKPGDNVFARYEAAEIPLQRSEITLSFQGANGEEISFSDIAEGLPAKYDDVDENGLPSLEARKVISQDARLYDLFQVVEISAQDAERRNMDGPGWYWVTYFADPSTGCAHVGPFATENEALMDASSKALPINDARRAEYKYGLIAGGKMKLQFVIGKTPE